MNIPLPFPDEHARGWRGRIRLFNHYPNVRLVVEGLRTWALNKNPQDEVLIKRRPQLMLLAEASGVDQRDFVLKHSSLPFIRAFMPDPFTMTRNQHQTMNMIGLYGLQTGKSGAWFCTDCVSEDLQTYGMPFWRRRHQVSGVNWCRIHGSKLLGLAPIGAFDHAPPVSISGRDLLLYDGPPSFSDVPTTIQNYAEIAEGLLARDTTLDGRRVTEILRHQAAFLMPEGFQEKDLTLKNIADVKLPDSWRIHFCSIKDAARGKFLVDLDRALRQTGHIAPTSVYVIALALLFDSPREALLRLDLAEHLDGSTASVKLGYERDFWTSDRVLAEYVKAEGSAEKFSVITGIAYRRVINAFRAHGLPDLDSLDGASRAALRAFFEGTSLRQLCADRSLNPEPLERILRVAASRLGNGLKNMS